MTRSRRSTLNLATHALSTLVTLVAALIATPLLLRWLGQETLGAHRAAVDWVSYLSLLELGLGGALMPMIARRINVGDSDGLARVIAAGFRAYRIVTVAMLLGGIALIVVIPFLVPVEAGAVSDLRLGVLLAVVALVFVPLLVLRPLWEAEQRGYAINVVLLLQSLIITAIALLLAHRGWGVTGQFAASLAGASVYFGVLAWQSLRRHPAALRWLLRPSSVSPDLHEEGAELWRLNWAAFAVNAAGRVGLLTDSIVIALLLQPAAVVPFILTQRLAQLAQGQLQAIGNATWAGLAHVHATDGVAIFRQRVIELTRLIVVIGLGVMLPILCFNRFFVSRWVGAAQFAGEMVTLLAVVNGLMLAVYSFWGWLFTASGHMIRLVRLVIASAVVNVTISFAATWWLAHHAEAGWALLGPLLGTATAFVGLYAWWLPLLLRRTFGIRPVELARAIFPAVLLALPCGAVIHWTAGHVDVLGWGALIVAMAAAAGTYLTLAWLLVFSREQRTTWRQRVAHVLTPGAEAEDAIFPLRSDR